MNWTSVKEQLPGIEQKVFVCCDKTGRVAGPVRLAEDKASEVRVLKSTEINPSGQDFVRYGGIGIYALGWSSGDLIFTEFMPTHWVAFPSVPLSASDGA